MKSWSRVPTARITSASAASWLALRGAQAADRAGVHRVVVDQHGAAGDGLADRDAVALGEGGQRRLGPAVAHAAAGDQERLPGRAQELRRRLELLAGRGAGAAMRWTVGSKKRSG